MDVLDLIRHETAKAYAWLDNICREVTHEQANWLPPGSANSIAASYAHAVIAADVDVNRYFLLRDPIIVGGWGARIGLHDLFPDDFAADGDIKWDDLRAYGREVARFMEGFVAGLIDADLVLEREMGATRDGKPISLGVWKGIDFVTLHGWSHIKMHGGEIACLKGIQGGEGYRPFNTLYA